MAVNNQHGRNGRLLLEDGTMINHADELFRLRDNDIRYHVQNGDAYISADDAIALIKLLVVEREL